MTISRLLFPAMFRISNRAISRTRKNSTEMRGRTKNLLINLTISIVITLLMLLLAEYLFRKAVLGDKPAFARWREPGLYADANSEDDFWILRTRFGQNPFSKSEPRNELGWGYVFNDKTYVHNNAAQTGKRRPVLLFGDSFAQCVDTTVCFDEQLNADSSFTKNYFMLNYGTGGYGTDQITALMER